MKTKVLFDFNNLAMRTLHLPVVGILGNNPSFEFWDYLVFNQIYEFITGVASETGDSVDTYLILDGRGGYWRREVYDRYKADRAEKRGRDNIDWDAVYANFDKFINSVESHMPWKVVRVPKCEADDVIAVIAEDEYTDQVIIHSTDSDYVQCLKPNVKLFNASQGYVTLPGLVKVGSDKLQCETPEEFLLYSIMTGQAGKDNVYNIKTASDWEPSEQAKRKPAFGPKTAKKTWLQAEQDFEKLLAWLQENSLLENFERNKKLIDLAQIPHFYKQQIREAVRMSDSTTRKVNLSGFLAERDWPSMADLATKVEVSDCLAIMAGVEQEEVTDTEVDVSSEVLAAESEFAAEFVL